MHAEKIFPPKAKSEKDDAIRLLWRWLDAFSQVNYDPEISSSLRSYNSVSDQPLVMPDDLIDVLPMTFPGLTWPMLNELLNFVLRNPRNPALAFPYEASGLDLRDEFNSNFNVASQEAMRMLMELDARMSIRNALEAMVSQVRRVGIIGQVAAGKTTFLNDMARMLQLSQAEIGVIRRETDLEIEADNDWQLATGSLTAIPPDVRRLMLQYEFDRIGSRGDEATMGSDTTTVFASQHPESDQAVLSRLSVRSYGGHMSADKYGLSELDAAACLFDYQALRQIADLDPSVRVTDRLKNGETIEENILGLLVNVSMISDLSCTKVGVLTKVPGGTHQTEETSALILAAYASALEIYVRNSNVLKDKILWLKDYKLDTYLLTPFEAQQLLFRMREQGEEETLSHGRIRLVGQARRFADSAATEGDAPEETVLARLGIKKWLAIRDTQTVGDDAYFTGTAEAVNALVVAACPGSKPITFGEKQAGQIAVAEPGRHLDNFV